MAQFGALLLCQIVPFQISLIPNPPSSIREEEENAPAEGGLPVVALPCHRAKAMLCGISRAVTGLCAIRKGGGGGGMEGGFQCQCTSPPQGTLRECIGVQPSFAAVRCSWRDRRWYNPLVCLGGGAVLVPNIVH